ncbi:MAG: MFS transporter [Deltaproteobacteria bacterium]|nr:MFS transporter [Deltaproteobacteria bacterium]MCW5801443.1 MFS transporter [Deltaproteobacteria bacterium]
MRDAVLGRIIRFVAARATNTFGRAAINATVLWELYERTHDTLVLAAVGLVQVIPVIALFLPSGVIADRVDRRVLATLAALGTGGVGIGLAVVSALDAPIAWYFVLLLFQGCVVSLHAPAAAALLANIGPREELPRANRILSSASELAQITAPALAGLALVVVVPSGIYAFVGVTATASALLYRTLPAIPIPRTHQKLDWKTGLRFIFRSPRLLPALTLDMFAVLFAGVTAVLPAIATDILHVGPFGYGLLRAAQSAGAVTMAIVGGRIAPWKRPGRVLLIVVALFGAATIGVGLSPYTPLTVVLLYACGALDNISVVIRLTLEQLAVPDAIRGRVGAVHNVFIGMSNELGAAESGLAADVLGLVPAIVAGGALSIAVVALVATRWPALAAMPPLSDIEPEPFE